MKFRPQTKFWKFWLSDISHPYICLYFDETASFSNISYGTKNVWRRAGNARATTPCPSTKRKNGALETSGKVPCGGHPGLECFPSQSIKKHGRKSLPSRAPTKKLQFGDVDIWISKSLRHWCCTLSYAFSEIPVFRSPKYALSSRKSKFSWRNQ